MTMDHPVFIAILAGLIVAAVLVGLRARLKTRQPPRDSPFDDERR